MEMKPVAWMSPDGKVSQTEGKLFHMPLYAAPKPLSLDEIMKLLNGIEYNPAEVETSFDYEIRIARAIEERHGIK